MDGTKSSRWHEQCTVEFAWGMLLLRVEDSEHFEPREGGEIVADVAGCAKRYNVKDL